MNNLLHFLYILWQREWKTSLTAGLNEEWGRAPGTASVFASSLRAGQVRLTGARGRLPALLCSSSSCSSSRSLATASSSSARLATPSASDTRLRSSSSSSSKSCKGGIKARKEFSMRAIKVRRCGIVLHVDKRPRGNRKGKRNRRERERERLTANLMREEGVNTIRQTEKKMRDEMW